MSAEHTDFLSIAAQRNKMEGRPATCRKDRHLNDGAMTFEPECSDMRIVCFGDRAVDFLDREISSILVDRG